MKKLMFIAIAILIISCKKEQSKKEQIENHQQQSQNELTALFTDHEYGYRFFHADSMTFSFTNIYSCYEWNDKYYQTPIQRDVIITGTIDNFILSLILWPANNYVKFLNCSFDEKGNIHAEYDGGLSNYSVIIWKIK